MSDTRELITVTTARMIVFAIGIGGPIVGAAVGVAIGARKKTPSAGLLHGLGFGLLGTLALILWFIYNAVISRMGFDSVAGFLVNLCIFVVVGIAAGLGIALLARRHRHRSGTDGGQ